TERNHAKCDIAAAVIVRTEADQFANSKREQNHSSGDLKIRHRNSERFKNNFAEKNKPNRDQQSGKKTEKRLTFPMFARCPRPESQENCDQPDRVDCDKNRNECEQKSFNHFATDEHR